MVPLAQANQIVSEAAAAMLSEARFSRAVTEDSVDSTGHDALNVTIVLKDSAVDSVDGDMALDTIVEIKRRLELADEQRFALVEFATETEMLSDGGP